MSKLTNQQENNNTATRTTTEWQLIDKMAGDKGETKKKEAKQMNKKP